MATFEGFGLRVFLVLSMGEFNSKAIVLRCVRTNPNRGRKIPVSFFTILWFPSSSPCCSIFPRRFRGSVIQWIFSYGRFHLRCHSICLSGIILRFGFCHHWALFVIEICFGEAITRKDILEEERKFIFNGLSLCRWFNSMCTQWRCFASPVLFWLFESKFYMYANTGVYNHPFVPQFQEYSRQWTFFKYWRSHQDYCGFQSSSQEQLGGQLFS